MRIPFGPGVALLLSLVFFSMSCQLTATEAIVPSNDSFVYLNEPRLLKVKQRIHQADSFFTAAYETLLKNARNELTRPVNPVTEKTLIPPSADKHDYLSIAPYWWPDTSKADGLPWIRKDGQVNPQTRQGDTDQTRLKDFFHSLKILGLAYFFSDDPVYAEKAGSLIHTWIVDPATRMNPNVNFGQAVPGLNNGRPAGIIEWEGLSALVSTVQILAKRQAIDAAFKAEIDAWLSQYLEWLSQSPIGIAEGKSRNNHANWYDYQLIGLQLYLGKFAAAKERLEAVKLNRIATQIETDGRMPWELERTKSVNYCSMNLMAMSFVAELGKRVDVDLWNYQTDDGRSIRRALDFLKPYALGEKPWEWEQIDHGAEESLRTIMLPMFSRVSTMLDEELLPADAFKREQLSYVDRLIFPAVHTFSGG